MKLRKPGLLLPSSEPKASPPACRNSFNITTITPIYGGGTKAGEPDLQMPVRASAIRGQLRFWWRLLKSNDSDNRLTGAALFNAERALWGGMAEGEEDYSSKVRLRVKEIDLGKVKSLCKSCASYVADPNKPGKLKSLPVFDKDVSSYALFPGKGELKQGNVEIKKDPAKVLMAGFSFQLEVECPEERLPEVMQALRWWASFGGLGARTRRGLGAVRVEGLPQVQPDEARRYGCKLAVRPASRDATAAWLHAVEALKNFRQGPNLGRNPGQQGNRPGRSRWPEPGSIRAITGVHRIKADGTTSFRPDNPRQRDFPRAAFGLPIIFHFQNEFGDQARDPADCELKPVGHDRMASPLILKPIALDDGRHAPMALLLPAGHVRDVNLELRNSGKEARNPKLPCTLASGTWWPLDAAGRQASAASVRPLSEHQADNALDAFLNYFSKG